MKHCFIVLFFIALGIFSLSTGFNHQKTKNETSGTFGVDLSLKCRQLVKHGLKRLSLQGMALSWRGEGSFLSFPDSITTSQDWRENRLAKTPTCCVFFFCEISTCVIFKYGSGFKHTPGGYAVIRACILIPIN